MSTLGLIDSATVAVTVRGIDLLALKKLSLVSHALAQKIGGPGGREQKCLADTLDDLIRQIEIACATRGSREPPPETDGLFPGGTI